MTETLSIKVPRELKARLQAEAERRRTRPSALLRRALESILDEASSEASCYEMAKDILSNLDEGPGDLSTNKTYLDGFGK